MKDNLNTFKWIYLFRLFGVVYVYRRFDRHIFVYLLFFLAVVSDGGLFSTRSRLLDSSSSNRQISKYNNYIRLHTLCLHQLKILQSPELGVCSCLDNIFCWLEAAFGLGFVFVFTCVLLLRRWILVFLFLWLSLVRLTINWMFSHIIDHFPC